MNSAVISFDLNMETKVTAVVVTYNPNVEGFKKAICNLSENCEKIIIVDNGSSNFTEFSNLATTKVRIKQNVGVAKALNEGCKVAFSQGNPDWVLTLDQDSELHKNAVKEALYAYSKLNEKTRSKVGIIALGTTDGTGRNFETVEFEITSGNLVNASLLRDGSVRFRDQFFIDQIDFDFDIQVRKLGFVILKYQKKLIEHRAGTAFKQGKVIVDIENPQRLYYLARNSTALLFHGLTVHSYFWQLEKWNLNYAKVFGLKSVPKLIKIWALGVTHSVLNEFGQFNLP